MDVFNPYSEPRRPWPREVGILHKVGHLGLDTGAGRVGSRTKLSPGWPFLT